MAVAWEEQRASRIIDRHMGIEGPLLPMLHDLQEEFGHVPEAAVPLLATALNLSRAEVHGVVTFYHDFRREPAGRHVLKLCRAEACQAIGADPLHERLLKRLGLDWGATTPDGRLTVEATYCLGLCASGPAALMDGHVVGRLDDQGLDALVREAR